MDNSISLSVNTKNMAITQFCSFGFNSYCVLDDGRVFAADNDLGLCAIDDSDTDNGTKIEARIKTGDTDFGIGNQKRIRSIYFGGEAMGDIFLATQNDEGNYREYTFSPENTGGRQQSGKLSVGRDGKGRYWSFEIGNIDGCDFGVDKVEATVITLGRKPSGS